jgi:predicted RNA-binding Zn-ribbon protein involved in translation (DUF1610 family)
MKPEQLIKLPQNKRMMLFCEPCGYKRILDIAETIKDLPENMTSPIQLRIPQLDPSTNKTVLSKFQEQPKRHKCPQCGRAAKVRELLKPFSDALKKVDEDKEKQRLEEEKKKRLEDGKPPEKKIDPDFMG